MYGSVQQCQSEDSDVQSQQPYPHEGIATRWSIGTYLGRTVQSDEVSLARHQHLDRPKYKEATSPVKRRASQSLLPMNVKQPFYKKEC